MLADEDHEGTSHQFKVILIGDGTVGKTSLIRRFVDDSFGETYKQTVGVDFFSKRLELPGDVKVTLQIWDIGGQSIGGKMIHNYVAGSHAVLLCYDVTNHESFADLEDWYRVVRQSYKKQPMPLCVLVANKCDLGMHLCAVSAERHNQFADEAGLVSYRLSAKSGDQVHATFFRVAAKLAYVPLTGIDMSSQVKVVSATLVDHQRNDPDIGKAAGTRRMNNGRCAVQ